MNSLQQISASRFRSSVLHDPSFVRGNFILTNSPLLMAVETTRERHNAINGLGCLVKALAGRQVTIDLRDETTLTGTICEVDG